MRWKPVTKFVAILVAALTFLGVLLGIYEFYAENIRPEPMFVYIEDHIEFVSFLESTGGRERLELVFRFTNTSSGPASPRFISFHDKQDLSLAIGACVIGGSDLPAMFEPDETARISCRTAWVDVPPRDGNMSVFTASPFQDAVSHICSVRVWLAGDGNGDGLRRSYPFGTADYRRSNC